MTSNPSCSAFSCCEYTLHCSNGSNDFQCFSFMLRVFPMNPFFAKHGSNLQSDPGCNSLSAQLSRFQWQEKYTYLSHPTDSATSNVRPTIWTHLAYCTSKDPVDQCRSWPGPLPPISPHIWDSTQINEGIHCCVDDWPSPWSLLVSCPQLGFSSRRTPWHHGFWRLISGHISPWKTFSSNRELFWVRISFTTFEAGPLLCLPVTQSSLGRLLAWFPLVENLVQDSNFHFSLRFGHVELCSWRDFGSFHGKWHGCSASCRRWTKRKQQDVEILDFLKLWTSGNCGCCLRLKTCAPKPPLLHSKEIVAPVSECSMNCYYLVIVWFPVVGFRFA